MSIENLLEMAEDIANYFAAERNEAKAVAGVANHLRRFWDPRMRRKLIEHIRDTGGARLPPLVLKAVATLTDTGAAA